MLKVRIFYEKIDFLKYIGHRDFVNFIQRAIRRAELPVEFSPSLYSPRMKIKFSPALPLGFESICEYFDIRLREWMDKDEILKKLKEQVYSQMKIKGIVYLGEGKQAQPVGCVYRNKEGEEIKHFFGKKSSLKRERALVRIKFLY